MPRAARAVLSNIALHILQRGINRNDCFFAPSDYAAYLRYLRSFAEEFACSVHAYCLMTNHVHLLITPQSADACARLMKKLGQCYVQYINHRLERSGTLWEGRYHSCMVKSDGYVLACYRYIEQNPVRAGMVSSALEYRWSSYAVNARGDMDDLVRPHPSYEALAVEQTQRARAYRELSTVAPERALVEQIRKATKLGCVAGMIRRGRGRPTASK
jgi:putative transposase